MTYKEAKHYVFMSVKEGYMSEDDADRLESLPKREMIIKCGELGEQGDYYANEVRKE